MNGKKMTVSCGLCGKPVTVERPSTGDPAIDKLLLASSRRLMCNTCTLRTERLEKDEKFTRQAEQRQLHWKQLCPLLYHSSEAWLLSPASQENRTLRRERVEHAFGWIDRPQRKHSLILFGAASGTGKTLAAWLLLKQFFNRGKLIMAMSHKQLSETATALSVERSATSTRWAKMMRTVDVLMIDDLGKASFTTASGHSRVAEEFIHDVIEARSTFERCTIITSNHNRAEIAGMMSESFAEPFVRRLNEFYDRVNFDAEPT